MTMFDFRKLDQRVICLQKYRGIIVIRYEFSLNNSTNYDYKDLFTELIASQEYRNAFIWDDVTENEHGPFSIDRIRPNQYKELTHNQLAQEFQTLLKDEEFEPPTKEMASKVKLLLETFREDAKFYKLELEFRAVALHKPNRYEFHHDLSSIYWEFVEFIVIEPQSNLLYMIVFLYE
jgi:hypothetical protein